MKDIFQRLDWYEIQFYDDIISTLPLEKIIEIPKNKLLQLDIKEIISGHFGSTIKCTC